MTNKTLTLQSSKEELQAYFEAVCNIIDNNSSEFPINLDEVWPLVYAEKWAAVRALKNEFIEDVDYKTVHTITKRKVGSTRTTDYFITISCLEFLIVRPLKSIVKSLRPFEYRHKKAAPERGVFRPHL